VGRVVCGTSHTQSSRRVWDIPHAILQHKHGQVGTRLLGGMALVRAVLENQVPRRLRPAFCFVFRAPGFFRASGFFLEHQGLGFGVEGFGFEASGFGGWC